MSCWRVLELSEQPDGVQVPQLLVKPEFHTDSYTINLTCLSNIWSEYLDLEGIVDRAAKERAPIEVSKQDTTQLAILLENIQNSLGSSGESTCRISRTGEGDITIHTSIALPAPLDSLTWKFNLKKRTAMTLKNELILPLLISSHVQHERVNSLISTIKDKDKAISRLADQFDSSNLDLAAAFPVLSTLKTGRRTVKREQAAKHVPALQPFRVDAFKNDTANLRDPEITTLGVFQEALSECTPKVPPQLGSSEDSLTWWGDLPNQLRPAKATTKFIPKKETTLPRKETIDESSEGETEDEFETQENFKNRQGPTKESQTSKQPPAANEDPDASETEEDDDLDAAPSQKPLLRKNSPSPSTKPTSPLPAKAKPKGFRIGGRSKKEAETPPPPPEESDTKSKANDLPLREALSQQRHEAAASSPKKAKRVFKIGGKGKGPSAGGSQPMETTLGDEDREMRWPTDQPLSSPPSSREPKKEPTPVEEPEREETAEEKAERRRAELKRKTDEAAKKQAQQKKKRRF